jgi:hypothetical protein
MASTPGVRRTLFWWLSQRRKKIAATTRSRNAARPRPRPRARLWLLLADVRATISQFTPVKPGLQAQEKEKSNGT